jgi:hypothetical protein
MIWILPVDICAELGLRPLVALELEHNESGFVAKVVDPAGIDSFGSGPSIQEAIKDLVEVMRAEAISLRSRRARLSADMARELSVLDAILADEGVEVAHPNAYIVAPMKIGATGPEFSTALARNSYIPSSSSSDAT